MEIIQLLNRLRTGLSRAVGENTADGLLLSGGLDSGILAHLSPRQKMITVSLEGGGRDCDYVSLLDETLGLDTIRVTVGMEEALESLKHVIKILKSFDPALPNDLVVYFGLKEAKERGLSSIMMGDGADELFAGYSYMKDVSNLQAYIQALSGTMTFSSNQIGTYFGLEVKQPYLDPDFMELALCVQTDYKIRKDKGTMWGKWILRKAFEPELPPAFIWQEKRPLETGSGMTLLRKLIADRITDKEFEEKQRIYPVQFLCKEHVRFYEVYRDEVGVIPPPQAGEGRCPGCGAGLRQWRNHCRICGWVRPDLVFLKRNEVK